MSGPKPIEKFLGCFHRWGTDTIGGKTVRTVQYDMCDFMQSCLKLYSDLIEEIKPGSSKAIQPAELPTDTVSGGGNAPAPKYGDRWEHLPEQKAWKRVHDKPRNALFTPTGTKGGPPHDSLLPTRITRMIFHGWCADGGDASATPDGQLEDTWTNASTCHRNAAAKWTGETWFFEKGCQDPQPVQTSDDPLDFSSRQDPKGILAGVASRILMKIFYGARFARWDLLKVVTKLATMVTKWTTACDAALLRLMRYIKATVDWVLVGYVGDVPSDLSLQLYADADFAGADLPAVTLMQARLSGASFRQARLRGAVLNEAQAEDADFGGADLFEAQLRNAVLRRASLLGASLYSANLEGAELAMADLTGANLRLTLMERPSDVA
jgi:hypothetical protein